MSAHQVTVEAVRWNDEASEMLRAAVEHVSVSELKAQVEAGAVLFMVTDVAGLVGYYVLRVDQTADGAEGVLVAGAGRAGFDIVATMLPTIEKQFNGCDWLRVHTSRAGMAKKLLRLGYSGAEIVVRKKL